MMCSSCRVLRKAKLLSDKSYRAQVSPTAPASRTKLKRTSPKTTIKLSPIINNFDILKIKSRSNHLKSKSDHEKIEKIQWGGGYFVEREPSSDAEEQGSMGRWVRTKNDTADFLTLVRNLVLIKVAKMGFCVRSFMSEKGDQIFSVL